LDIYGRIRHREEFIMEGSVEEAYRNSLVPIIVGVCTAFTTKEDYKLELKYSVPNGFKTFLSQLDKYGYQIERKNEDEGK
jgi:hypothetical protein